MVRRLREKLQNVAKRASSSAAVAAKIVIRQSVLEAVGAGEARVFDAYAGSGHMHSEVWKHALEYVGCDIEFYRDDRVCFCADNRRVMRAIDLGQFNIFDLDAYGSPWEQLLIIASRRILKPGETLGFAITEGQGMKLKLGGMSLALAQLSGVRHFLPGLAKNQDELIDRAILKMAAMMGGSVTRRWGATQRTGSTMHYIGLVMTGNGPDGKEHR